MRASTEADVEAFRARNGLWKKYADEASPLGRFLRSNQDFPRDASVELFIDTALPDAVISTGGAETPYEFTGSSSKRGA